jgi:hypothetical protein
VADDDALSPSPLGRGLTEAILGGSDCRVKFQGLQRIAILVLQLVKEDGNSTHSPEGPELP